MNSHPLASWAFLKTAKKKRAGFIRTSRLALGIASASSENFNWHVAWYRRMSRRSFPESSYYPQPAAAECGGGETVLKEKKTRCIVVLHEIHALGIDISCDARWRGHPLGMAGGSAQLRGAGLWRSIAAQILSCALAGVCRNSCRRASFRGSESTLPLAGQMSAAACAALLDACLLRACWDLRVLGSLLQRRLAAAGAGGQCS